MALNVDQQLRVNRAVADCGQQVLELRTLAETLEREVIGLTPLVKHMKRIASRVEFAVNEITTAGGL